MRKKFFFFGLALTVGLIFGLVLAVRFDLFSPVQSQSTTVPAAKVQSAVSGTRLSGVGSMEDSVINVAETSGLAVVSISAESTRKAPGFGGRQFYFESPFGGQSPFGDDDFFNRFFDDFFGGMPDSEYKQMGLGSGVIIDRQGHILTNEHVVSGADKIAVTLSDGRKFDAELKGQDPRSDLAIIKIDAEDLPLAALGDSDQVKIGQWVVAIGNPFGFAMDNPEPTVTVGVVSALHRSLGRILSADRDYNDLIQTDAAINPGNSGGPLVNLHGEVVGINVAIFSTSGGYQGVGFAIPINNAKRIISRLIVGEKIVYGWLGVTVQNLSEDLVEYFGLKDKEGVLVASILEDGPAQEAGIKTGDVIKKFDGQPIPSVKELLSVVGKTEAGKRVKLLVVRNKKEVAINIVVGERPETLEGKVQAEDAPAEGQWRGLTVEDLGARKHPGRPFMMPQGEKGGVLVVAVEPESPASQAGVIPGDVITEINYKPVKNLADYQKITKGIKGDCLVLTSHGYLVVKEK